MPQPNGDLLPPLTDKDFDGEKQQTSIPAKGEITSKCPHKDVSYDQTKGELRCVCGVAFKGPNLHILYNLLKNQ